MTQTASRSALAFLDAASPLPVPAAIALRVAVMFTKWEQRRRSRVALGKLDTHLLQDIGMGHLQARAEARKYFWQD